MSGSGDNRRPGLLFHNNLGTCTARNVSRTRKKEVRLASTTGRISVFLGTAKHDTAQGCTYALGGEDLCCVFDLVGLRLFGRCEAFAGTLGAVEGAAEDEAVVCVVVGAVFALWLAPATAVEEVRGGGGAAGDEAGRDDVLMAAAVVAGASSA